MFVITIEKRFYFFSCLQIAFEVLDLNVRCSTVRALNIIASFTRPLGLSTI